MFTQKNIILPVLTVMLTVTSLQAQDKPNVVVIIVDDLGYADMSFLPQAPTDIKHYKTPGFDRLFATGTYFENAYSTSPICRPSRAGIRKAGSAS
jgi:arylsulfatase A-like enzyme